MKSFALQLCGCSDDLLVLVTDNAADIILFLDHNPPVAVDGDGCITTGPLADARRAIGCGPSVVLGYRVVKLINGKPVGGKTTYWTYGEWGNPGEATQEERNDAWNADTRRALTVWMQS